MSYVILNAEDVQLPAEPTCLLDILRDRGLTGAKPGCRGGDCGACQVLVGEIDPATALPRYRTVNSCLLTTDQVADHHVITIEGLSRDLDSLVRPSLVHQALVTAGAIQCGYCTPGLVVALTGALLAGDPLEAAIAGNLCRCTGYAGIRRALAGLTDLAGTPLSLHRAADLGLLPRSVAVAGDRLRPLSPVPSSPAVLPLGGNTDYSVHHPREHTPARLLRRVPELRTITAIDDTLEIGAAVTVAELQESPLVGEAWPGLAVFLDLFGSPAIRHVATVGGNLANASPAADVAVALLALGTEVSMDGPGGRRDLDLADFFLGYRHTALAPGEILTGLRLPRNRGHRGRLHAEKISRRPHDDVATVTSAMVVSGGDDETIGRVRLAAGGVAPTPLLLAATAKALSGRPISDDLTDALDLVESEISPIDDVRGTATYKARLLRHVVLAHLVALHPGLDVPRYLP